MEQSLCKKRGRITGWAVAIRFYCMQPAIGCLITDPLLRIAADLVSS